MQEDHQDQMCLEYLETQWEWDQVDQEKGEDLNQEGEVKDLELWTNGMVSAKTSNISHCLLSL